MKNLLLIFLLFMGGLSASAQCKLRLGGHATFGLTDAFHLNRDGVSDPEFSDIRQDTRPTTAFSSGLIAHLEGARWGFRTGFNFTRSGYHFSAEVGSGAESSASVRFGFTELPFQISRKLSDRIRLSAGPSLTYLYSLRVREPGTKFRSIWASLPDDESFNRIGMAAEIGISWEIPLSPNTALQLEPQFRGMLGPLTSSAAVARVLWNGNFRVNFVFGT